MVRQLLWTVIKGRIANAWHSVFSVPVPLDDLIFNMIVVKPSQNGEAWSISSVAARWLGAQSDITMVYSPALRVTLGAAWTLRHHLVFPNNNLQCIWEAHLNHPIRSCFPRGLEAEMLPVALSEFTLQGSFALFLMKRGPLFFLHLIYTTTWLMVLFLAESNDLGKKSQKSIGQMPCD